MNIDELEKEKVRLTKQLLDVLREKDEIQASLNKVLNELQAHNSSDPEQQIWDKRNEINYDTRDYTLEHIINYHKGRNIECILPTTRWDASKQSKFIESFLLGLPLILYMAAIECVNPYLQVIDGNQRVLTLDAFINNKLQLTNLEVLDSLNGLYFQDLVPSRRRKFLNTSVRVVIFSNPSNEVKKDLANRFKN